MRYAEVKKDVYVVPEQLRSLFNGKNLIDRDELLAQFKPLVRARRRGHYDASRGILITIEPRTVVELPEKYVRYLGD